MTTQERHEFYKLMLHVYNSRTQTDGLGIGFCWVLSQISRNFFMNPKAIENYIDNELNELSLFKPKDFHGAFWFPTKDTSKRISILKECIKLTES